jgi:hypothetical protein
MLPNKARKKALAAAGIVASKQVGRGGLGTSPCMMCPAALGSPPLVPKSCLACPTPRMLMQSAHSLS